MLNIFSTQANSHASTIKQEFTVARVVDGDTLMMVDSDGKKVLVRLYGIDCPERGQEFGPTAAQIARSLLTNQNITATFLYKDRFGREVAIVWLPDDSTLQEKLLKAGAGWVVIRYCKRQECAAWKEAELTAREQKTGLWQAPQPIAPWKWRRMSHP